jgi:hypothetical protein
VAGRSTQSLELMIGADRAGSEEAVERIIRIGEIKFDKSLDKVSTELLYGYFKNAHEFLAAVGQPSWFPFFDAVEIVDPTLSHPGGGMLRALNSVDEKVGGFSSSLLRAYARLKLNCTDTRLAEWRHLYDPLLGVLENGVPLTGVRKGDLVVGIDNACVPLKYAQRSGRSAHEF